MRSPVFMRVTLVPTLTTSPESSWQSVDRWANAIAAVADVEIGAAESAALNGDLMSSGCSISGSGMLHKAMCPGPGFNLRTARMVFVQFKGYVFGVVYFAIMHNLYMVGNHCLCGETSDAVQGRLLYTRSTQIGDDQPISPSVWITRM